MSKMKIGSWLVYITIFFFGLSFGNLIWYLRFSNPTLRNELIVMMQQGNEYFLIWFLWTLSCVVTMAAITIAYNRKERFGKGGKHSHKVETK